MIPALKPYPKYNATQSPWLQEIPDSWDFRRAKTILNERNEKGFPNEPLLAATQSKGVVRKENFETRTVLAQKDLHNLKLVQVDDFVISLRSFQGGIEYAREKGIISPAYTILFPFDSRNQRYLSWLFKSKDYIDNLKLHVTGIREGQNIDYVKLSRSRIPIPTRSDQKAIVRYLDYMDRRIQKYIAAKEKLIQLLEEQKQAVIHQAVTRGLDPDVPLKPSGVEWLGDIPKHWELSQGRGCLSIKKQVNTGMIESKVLSLSYGNIVIKPKEKLHGLVPESFETYQLIYPGDIVCRPTDLQNDKKSLRFGLSQEQGIITSAYLRFTIKENINEDYVYLLLHAYDILKVIYRLGSGLRQNLSWDDFKSLPILLPPLPEQEAIVEFVNKIRIETKYSIDRLEQEIDLLNEYQKSLISNIVTGKIDIREMASNTSDYIDTSTTLEVYT